MLYSYNDFNFDIIFNSNDFNIQIEHHEKLYGNVFIFEEIKLTEDILENKNTTFITKQQLEYFNELEYKFE